jgi:hypothetical protein
MLELHSGTLGNLQASAGSGQFSDGTLMVNISGYTGSSFSWMSNIGVDSLLARTSGGGSLVEYSPERTSDQGVNAGGAITFLSFCYDVDSVVTPPPTSTPKITPPPTDISFGDVGSGGISGLTMALLLIAGVAATLVIGSARRPAPAPARGGGAAGPWSTQAAWPRRR